MLLLSFPITSLLPLSLGVEHCLLVCVDVYLPSLHWMTSLLAPACGLDEMCLVVVVFYGTFPPVGVMSWPSALSDADAHPVCLRSACCAACWWVSHNKLNSLLILSLEFTDIGRNCNFNILPANEMKFMSKIWFLSTWFWRVYFYFMHKSNFLIIAFLVKLIPNTHAKNYLWWPFADCEAISFYACHGCDIPTNAYVLGLEGLL